MLKRLFPLLCAFALLLPMAARAADEPTVAHLAAARELINVTGAAAGIDRIVPALVENIRQQSVTRPEMSKDLEEVLKALEPDFQAQRQQALTVAARVYAKFMTEAEINATLTFFKSPAGAKYIQVQPELTDEVVSNVTAWSQIAAEYIQTRVRAEMLKRGHQL